MIESLALILLCQLTGEVLARLAHLPVPGPVIAMGISEQIGGLPSLTAAMVLITGICGAVIGPFVLNRLKIRDPRARSLAMGTASHGIVRLER